MFWGWDYQVHWVKQLPTLMWVVLYQLKPSIEQKLTPPLSPPSRRPLGLQMLILSWVLSLWGSPVLCQGQLCPVQQEAAVRREATLCSPGHGKMAASVLRWPQTESNWARVALLHFQGWRISAYRITFFLLVKVKAIAPVVVCLFVFLWMLEKVLSFSYKAFRPLKQTLKTLRRGKRSWRSLRLISVCKEQNKALPMNAQLHFHS